MCNFNTLSIPVLDQIARVKGFSDLSISPFGPVDGETGHGPGLVRKEKTRYRNLLTLPMDGLRLDIRQSLFNHQRDFRVVLPFSFSRALQQSRSQDDAGRLLRRRLWVGACSKAFVLDIGLGV